MSVDLYQLCPCGSGKKIKFCCRDLAHDLERIQRMIDGDQRLAALDKIDSLLKKREKPSERLALLMMKAEIRVQLKEIEAAKEIISEMLAIEPKNPSALALHALTRLMEPDNTVREALDNIQNALKNVRQAMNRIVYEALRGTIVFLIAKRFLFSAKGYLQFSVMITDGKDPNAVRMLNRINRSDELDFLLREHIDSSARPANVTWGREFDVAMHVASQGNWGDAASLLKDMSYRILDEPSILRNLAIIQGLNAQLSESAASFRQFAALKRISMLDRVHAEALATAIHPESSGKWIDVNQVTAELKNANDLIEALRSNKKLEEAPSQISEEKQAQAMFLVHDKPMPSTGEEITLENLPNFIGHVFIFGKRTDREARVEVTAEDNDNIQEIVDLVQSAAGEGIAAWSEPTPVRKVLELKAKILDSPRIDLVDDRETRLEFVAAMRRKAFLEKWPDTPRAAYNGKTPRQVVEETPDDLRLLAELLTIEIESELDSWDISVDDVRKAVGLPERERIDLTKRKIEHVPVSHLGRVDIEGLSDEDLLKVYRYAYAVMAGGILYRIAREIANRHEQLKDKIDFVEVYDVLSDLSTDFDESLEWLDKARRLATSQGESPAMWLIDEMELRLLRGDAERFHAIFKEIQHRYMKEPGVGQALFGLLHKYGLINANGEMATSPEAARAAKEPASSELWTPESSPTSGEAKSESKLWVPD